MPTTTETPAGENIKTNIKVALIGFVGIIIFIVHGALLYFNMGAFNVLVCLYTITYAVIVLITTGKNTGCYKKTSFNILVNFSLYTVILQIFLLAFVIIKIATKK